MPTRYDHVYSLAAVRSACEKHGNDVEVGFHPTRNGVRGLYNDAERALQHADPEQVRTCERWKVRNTLTNTGAFELRGEPRPEHWIKGDKFLKILGELGIR